MPANQMADQYLHTFRADGEFPGGLAFRKALVQADLDFTPESLARIDRLLRQMRTQLQPSYGAFTDRQDNQNFLYLLCFYVGAVVYRYTGEGYAWYPYDELKQVAPPDFLAQYPEAFASSMICMLEESGTFLPLSSILDVLFGDDPERSVLASADQFMNRLSDATPIARPSAPLALREDKVTGALRAAAGEAGWAAGFAIWTICEGAALGRMMQHRMPNGQRLGVALMHGSLQEAFDRLENNEEGALESVLSYQGVVGLPARRSEAVVLEVRRFGEAAIMLTMVVPFRPAGATAGFAVGRPRVLRPANLSAAAQQVIAAGFFEGIDSYRPAGLLEKYLDPSV
ncbi:hypothetical protein [Massilia sp. Leaf139]|uniref:hypothetical protein n=1 Tax=Massilia sp. Leaf139 TaxID=1736272 RepID=UPI0006FCE5A7|nr:hypothetical protein [Massilia sp. Leaf139]KQQ96498.1 hypothetical protein ASF77_00385 [Massilia sp. Leaf139]